MHSIEQHIENQLAGYKDHFFFVACSGGVDSTVLLYILQKLGYSVRALHMNYQLRGKDSDDDAKFIRQFAQSIQVETIVKTLDLNKELESGGNLQELARQHRYWWFHDTIQNHKNVKVLLAHHRDDQVETFLMNLARKSGFMGLSAMPYERDDIVRPMLDISKEELIAYAKQYDIPWRDDKSNLESKYKRNMLRNIILPELRKEIPTIDDSIYTMIRVFQSNQKDLEHSVQPYLQSVFNDGFISKDSYNEMNEFQAIEFFRQLEMPHTVYFELARIKRKGAVIELPDWVPDYNMICDEGDGYSFLDNQHGIIPELQEEVVDSIPTSFDKNVIYLDHYKISGNLHVRPWKMGDRIAPVGMNGSQLVSDIIYQAKLRRNVKESIVVVHDDHDIHWVPGLKIGRKAIADNQSKEILKVRINPEVPLR
jgi:tRNA(Ile)-lysidine synthase